MRICAGSLTVFTAIGFLLVSCRTFRQRDLLEHPGSMPIRNAHGQYTCMLDSIRAGDVTEIGVDRITRWGSPQLVMWEGCYYWTIQVAYRTNGLSMNPIWEARAFIRDGRVHFWRYVGSCEMVP